jgi:hypothetical protein
MYFHFKLFALQYFEKNIKFSPPRSFIGSKKILLRAAFNFVFYNFNDVKIICTLLKTKTAKGLLKINVYAQAALQSPVLRAVLEDIFLVRRVQTVAEVFAMSVNMARAFSGSASATLYDDQALCKPVKRLVYAARDFYFHRMRRYSRINTLRLHSSATQGIWIQ